MSDTHEIPWHQQLPVHTTTAKTILDFLKATAPTPVYGKNYYQFRYNGSSRDADALRNQLRVALTRIRNKAKARGLAIYPFTMVVAEPETHTIDGETFHVMNLSRQVYTRNPFENIIDAQVVLAVADREHPPTKMIADMLQDLATHGIVAVDMENWQQLTSVMWLVAHDYAKPKMHDYKEANLYVRESDFAQHTATFIPIYRNNHVNTVNTVDNNTNTNTKG